MRMICRSGKACCWAQLSEPLSGLPLFFFFHSEVIWTKTKPRRSSRHHTLSQRTFSAHGNVQDGSRRARIRMSGTSGIISARSTLNTGDNRDQSARG